MQRRDGIVQESSAVVPLKDTGNVKFGIKYIEICFRKAETGISSLPHLLTLTALLP